MSTRLRDGIYTFATVMSDTTCSPTKKNPMSNYYFKISNTRYLSMTIVLQKLPAPVSIRTKTLPPTIIIKKCEINENYLPRSK